MRPAGSPPGETGHCRCNGGRALSASEPERTAPAEAARREPAAEAVPARPPNPLRRIALAVVAVALALFADHRRHGAPHAVDRAGGRPGLCGAHGPGGRRAGDRDPGLRQRRSCGPATCCSASIRSPTRSPWRRPRPAWTSQGRTSAPRPRRSKPPRRRSSRRRPSATTCASRPPASSSWSSAASTRRPATTRPRARSTRRKPPWSAPTAELERARQALGPEGAENPQLREALAALEQAQLDLRRTSVTAPSDGVVSNLQLSIGQVVAPGQSAMTFIDAATIWITAAFKENSLEYMSAGDPAEVVLDSLPGSVFPAKVESIGWGVAQGNIDPVTGLPDHPQPERLGARAAALPGPRDLRGRPAARRSLRHPGQRRRPYRRQPRR